LDGLEKISLNCQLNVSHNAALKDVGTLSPAGNIARWFEIAEAARTGAPESRSSCGASRM